MTPGDRFFEAIEAGADPAAVAEAADRAAAIIVRGAHGADQEAVGERLLHLAETEGIETIAELWSGAAADSLAGCLWRLYLLRQWVYADPGRRRAPVRGRPPARPGGGSGRRGGGPAGTRRAEDDDRPRAARHRGVRLRRRAVPGRGVRPRRRDRSCRLSTSPPPTPRGCARWPTSSSRPPVRSSPTSWGKRVRKLPGLTQEALNSWRVPGRGSPGSQLQPPRAALRREALPVRHTTSLTGCLGCWPCPSCAA